jgi:arylsulfatase A-like enzyme
MIISIPEIAAATATASKEFVDIFPTLCDLAGVKIPETLYGKRLESLMNKNG